MSSNIDYVATMEKQMKQWDADFDALTAAGAKASGDAYRKGIEGLRANRAAAQETFQEIRLANQAAGEKLQQKMGTAFETMQKALVKATADLKK